MYRIIAAVCVWVLLLGGVSAFMWQRERAQARRGPVAVAPAPLAAGHWEIEVTATFTARPDPFALREDADGVPFALRVQLAEREVLRIEEGLDAGVPLRVADIGAVAAGRNELFLEASPPLESAGSHAVRLRVLRDGRVRAEGTFWADGGERVAGSLYFDDTETDGKNRQHEQ